MRRMGVPVSGQRAQSAALPTLRELLGTDRLRLHLVSGPPAALDRRIRWVHSTELPDPSRYLRGGELVCTVGANLLDPAACARFVAALAAVDAAGMCFGVGDVHQQTPEAVLTACHDRGLPLIEVPHGERFLALADYLAEYRIAAESQISARGERLVAGLLAAVRRGADLEELMGTAVAALGGGLLARIGASELRAGAVGGAGTGADTVEAALGDSVLVRWQGTGEPPTVDLLTQVARVLDVASFEQETERRRHRERIGQLLSLVADSLADVGALLPTLEQAGFGSGEVTVSAWPAGTGQLLAAPLPNALIAEAPDAAFAITRGPAEVHQAAETLTLACGYGSSVVVSELARGIAEARACLQLARRYRRLVGPHELTSLEGLLEQQPRARLDPFVSQLVLPLSEYDRLHRGRLLETLRTFLRLGGSLQETARVLYLHVNTVRHRLRRIAELTGRDPAVFNDRIALAIALWTFDRNARRAWAPGAGR